MGCLAAGEETRKPSHWWQRRHDSQPMHQGKSSTGGSGGMKGFQGVRADKDNRETPERKRWYKVPIHFEDDNDVNNVINKGRCSELRIPADFEPNIQSRHWVTMDTWTQSASKDRMKDRQQSGPREQSYVDFESSSNVDGATKIIPPTREVRWKCDLDTPRMTGDAVHAPRAIRRDVLEYQDKISREVNGPSRFPANIVPEERQSRNRIDRRAESVAERIARESKERGSRENSCSLSRESNHLSMERMVLDENSHRVDASRTSFPNDDGTSKKSFPWEFASMSDHTLNEDGVRRRMTYNGSDTDQLTTGKSSRMNQSRTGEKDTSVTQFWTSDGSRAVVESNRGTGYDRPEQQECANQSSYGHFVRCPESSNERVTRESKEERMERDSRSLSQERNWLSMEETMMSKNSNRVAVEETDISRKGEMSRERFQRDAASISCPTSNEDDVWKSTMYRDSDADRLETIKSSQMCQFRTREKDTLVAEVWTSDGRRSVVPRGYRREDDRPEQRVGNAVNTEAGNPRAYGFSSGEEIVEDSLTPGRYRRFPSTGHEPVFSRSAFLSADEFTPAEKQRLQVDPLCTKRYSAEEKRVPVGDRYDEPELIEISMMRQCWFALNGKPITDSTNYGSRCRRQLHTSTLWVTTLLKGP